MTRKALIAVCLSLAITGVSHAQIDYFSDFEVDGGGFVGDFDWERGVGTGFAGSFGSSEPVGGFSGDFIWGTVIGGDHSPSTTSTLTQNFDFTGAFGTTITFVEWSDSGSNAFDTAELLINGNQEYISDGFSGDAWRPVNIDLSAYDNLASVDVSFVFTTTGVVERTGWYIDDVGITSIPEPAAAGLLGSLALIGLGIRRRRKA